MSNKRLPGLADTPRELQLRGLRRDPVLRSIVNKGIRDIHRPSHLVRDGGFQNTEAIAQLALQRAGFTGSDINDYKAIMDMLPDIRRVCSLLVDGILSPNDATPSPLHYTIDPGKFPDKDVVGKLVDLITDYFRNVHKIDSKLKPMLEDILFKRGSRPFFILPEASLDRLINPNGEEVVSMESASRAFDNAMTGFSLVYDNDYIHKYVEAFKQHKRNTKEKPAALVTSLESIKPSRRTTATFNEFGLRIDGNYQSVLKPKLMGRLTRMALSRKLINGGMPSLGLESLQGEGEDYMADIVNALNRDRHYMADHIKTVTPLSKLDKPTVGHAIEFALTSESVIPIHVPGQPDEHVAYFVLLDEDANPISMTGGDTAYESLQRRTEITPNALSSVLSESYLATYGGSSREDQERNANTREMEYMYAEVVSNYLAQSLKDADIREVQISRPGDVYKMLLKRSLQQQNTRLLFVPASMMVYMAFQFNDQGIGEPLLENVRIPAALRAILNFAHVNGEIRNSIAHTRLNIELDELDPEPEVTVNEIMQQFISMRGGSMVFGSRPSDIVNQLNQASIEVAVSGNERYDQTRVDVEEVSRQVNTPTMELDDRLKDMIYSGLGGIPPELVDRSMDVDFAAEYIGAHNQLIKLAMSYQTPFCEFLAEYCRKIILNSSILMRDAISIVKEARGDKNGFGDEFADMSDAAIVAFLLERLQTELPKPQGVSLEAQMTALNEYINAVETVIDRYLSNDVIGNLAGGDIMQSHLDEIRDALLSSLIRDFISINGILPEVAELFQSTDEEDIERRVMYHKDFYDNIRRNIAPLIKVFSVVGRQADEDLANIEEGDGSYSDSDGDSDSGGGDFDFGDDGDDDDFGMDDDFGGDDESDDTEDEDRDMEEDNIEDVEEPTESDEAVQDTDDDI